jgi:hypothetical protein
MVLNICGWNILLGLRCYHYSRSSKSMESSSMMPNYHLILIMILRFILLLSNVSTHVQLSYTFVLTGPREHSLCCIGYWWVIPY